MAFQRTPQPRTSPWGAVQIADELAPGIWQVHTAGHGGILVSDERWRAMPAALRANPYGGAHWFEEDCEALLVLFAFRGEITGGNAASIPRFALSWAQAQLKRDGHLANEPYNTAARYIIGVLDPNRSGPAPLTEATAAGAQAVIPGAEKRQRPTATQLELLF